MGVDSESKAVVKKYPTARVVGTRGLEGLHVDGLLVGHTTAEVHHDWAQKGSGDGSDLATAVSKRFPFPQNGDFCQPPDCGEVGLA